MQIKLLPTRKKNQKQSQPQGSPNLLSEKVYHTPPLIEIRPRVITYTKVIVVIICLLFVSILLYNLKVHTDIQRLEDEIDEINSQLEQRSQKEKEITSVINKTIIYKRFKAQQAPLADKIAIATTNLPSDVSISSVIVRAKDVEIEMTGSRALAISQLILKYLESDRVSEIVLRGARLSTRDNSFSAELEIKFKE